MTETKENDTVYCRPGLMFTLKMRNQIRKLFIRERRKQGLSLEEVSSGSGIPVERLARLEDHRKHLSWYILDKLMCFYRKKIEMRLVDWDKE